MAIVLGARGLCKAYDARPLFEGLDLGVEDGARMGLIGPNGSGKSTLLRILAGLEQADEGERAVAQGLRLVYLPQSDSFAAGLTPVGAVELALTKSHPHWDDHERSIHAMVMLGKSGFDSVAGARSDQLIEALSGGWRKRLAITCALAQEPDVLLMDEPTNHLDLEGVWWLESVLTDAAFTYVVISHDRFFLERVCNRVVEINRMYPGGCFMSTGGYSAFLAKRAEFIANQRKQQDVLDNKVRREIEWLQRNPSAQTCKSKSRVDQAGDLMRDLAELKYRNNQNRRVDIDFTATGRRTNDLVVLDGVSKSLGGKPLFSDVELTLSPGSRLGLLGLNGSGKTTLLRVLAGQLPPDSGTVRQAGELKIVIFDQKREQLNPAITLRRALCPNGDTVIYRGRGTHIAAWAKRFLFSPAQLDLEVGKLSGGEQARVLIANLMRKDADLLVLDEPTNDLDIPSLEVLEDSLSDFPGAVVLVTHDRYLLDRVSTALLALDGRGNAYRIADCSQWEQLAARIQAERDRELSLANRAANAPVETPVAKPAAPVLSRDERRELERMGGRIQAAEAKHAECDKAVNDPAVMADARKLEAACAALAAAQREVEKLYARWEELEAKAGG
jgi:ATP-binding cassette subfamily F protein uup